MNVVIGGGIKKTECIFSNIRQKMLARAVCKTCNLWSRPMEISNSVGVLDRLLAESIKVHTRTVYAYRTFIRHNELDAFTSPYSSPVLIEQNSIEHEAEVIKIDVHPDFVEALVKH